MSSSHLSSMKMLDVNEVAEIIGVSARTVWRMESCGGLPRALRLGRIVRWRLSDIEDWIDAKIGDVDN